MLDELVVTNLGLIERARVEPGAGLVVVSGETGAGKTLLLGALRLLAGEQARRDHVGPRGDELRVEGRFVSDDAETVVARVVQAAGRSRAYMNGSMVTASELSNRADGTVEIVAQHDHLALAAPNGVRRLIDGSLSKQGRRAATQYGAAWAALQDARAKEEALGGDTRALQRELEMVRFQADEIAEAGFRPGEGSGCVL